MNGTAGDEEPGARCDVPDCPGRPRVPTGRTPEWIGGARFHFEGKIHFACYQRLAYRERLRLGADRKPGRRGGAPPRPADDDADLDDGGRCRVPDCPGELGEERWKRRIWGGPVGIPHRIHRSCYGRLLRGKRFDAAVANRSEPVTAPDLPDPPSGSTDPPALPPVLLRPLPLVDCPAQLPGLYDHLTPAQASLLVRLLWGTPHACLVLTCEIVHQPTIDPARPHESYEFPTEEVEEWPWQPRSDASPTS